MHRIDSATKSADLFGAGKDGFKNGNKVSGIAATDLTADFFNDVQENICAVIEGAGSALTKGDGTQLRAAITKMIQAGQRAVIINSATFAGAVTGTGKAVYWDSGNSRFDLALADGSIKQSAVGFADVPNGNVYCFGDAVLFSGLTPGARYYLDTATAGAITTVLPAANAVFVGIAKNATEVFVDLDAVPQTVISNVGQLKNLVINGSCLVAQRPVASLGLSAGFGQVDRFSAWGAGTAVSAGTITQDSASPIGRTGAALKLSGVTITGAGIIYTRHRIESANAKRIKNQSASFSVLVHQDTGGSINYTVTIRKPTAADNFSSMSVIATGSAVSVATATGTQLTLANVAMGDCSNGIEIEVSAACGAVATRNFSFTEWQLEEGPTASSFERRDVGIELPLCLRYFEILFGVVTGSHPGASNSYVSWLFKTRKRATPTIVTAGTTTGSAYISSVDHHSRVLVGNHAIVGDGTTAECEL